MNKDILIFINKGIFFLKKTNNIYNSSFDYNNSIIRTESFYSEEKPIYTWQKKGYGSLYIYGNPYPSYDFNIDF